MTESLICSVGRTAIRSFATEPSSSGGGSGPPGGTAEYLSAPQSDWMDAMTNQGNYSDFEATEFYDPKKDGPAILYNMKLPSSEPVTCRIALNRIWCILPTREREREMRLVTVS